MKQTAEEHRSAVFDSCMQDLSAMYQREFPPAAVRLYYQACDGWSEDKMREVFKRAIQSERYCPTVAIIIAYGGGVHEQTQSAADYQWPKYTPEQLAELKAMRKLFNENKPDVPWANDPNSVAGSLKL